MNSFDNGAIFSTRHIAGSEITMRELTSLELQAVAGGLQADPASKPVRLKSPYNGVGELKGGARRVVVAR